jgi:hypothetical protein
MNADIVAEIAILIYNVNQPNHLQFKLLYSIRS